MNKHEAEKAARMLAWLEQEMRDLHSKVAAAVARLDQVNAAIEEERKRNSQI